MNNDANHGKNTGEQQPPSHLSHSSPPQDRIIPPRGDYQTLHSFHKAEVIYDLTFRFAHKYLALGDRTIDQMIQAARARQEEPARGQQGRAHLQGNRA